VKFLPLHLLYRASRFIITKGLDGIVSVAAILDEESHPQCLLDEEDRTTIVTSTFDNIIENYGEDSVCIPQIISAFIFSEISSFSPTVSGSSRQSYVDYIEKNKI